MITHQFPWRMSYLGALLLAAGCVPDHSEAIKAAAKEAAESIEESTKTLDGSAARFGADLKVAMKNIDPAGIQRLLTNVEQLRVTAEEQETTIRALRDQLSEKLPVSITGEYRPRYLSKDWGAPSFVKHIEGTYRFRFWNVDEKNKFDKIFTWDQKRQLFVADDGQVAFFFPDTHLIAFADGGHWFQPKPG
ncbi:MAG: hypothetical protein ABSH35_21350 [Isosphaeraceae bacterium]|jgi:hypothetical protein